jgi:hypothetical protein
VCSTRIGVAYADVDVSVAFLRRRADGCDAGACLAT